MSKKRRKKKSRTQIKNNLLFQYYKIRKITKNKIMNINSMYCNAEVERIINFISEKFSISIEDLKSPKRHRPIVIARQLICFYSKEFLNVTHKHIGIELGNRDHSTVVHAITSIENDIYTNQSFKKNIIKIGEEIFGAEEFPKMWQIYLKSKEWND